MRANEFIIESLQQTTLAQLYNGNYPDRDEAFWDYVSPSEFNTPLTIQTLQRHKVMITLLGQYRAEHIDEITDMLDDEQQEIVQSYVNDPQLSSKVIVLAGHRIIDGNHRALAAAIKGVSINYVDLSELNDEEVDEDMSRRGFLRGLGAAGLAAAGGNAFAKAQRTERVIVSPGDTIYSIARNFGINPAEIYKLNKFDRNTRLEVGQQVLVPAGPSSVPSVKNNTKPSTTTLSTPTHAKPATATPSTPAGKVGNNALQEPGFIEKLQKVANSLGVSANALAGIIKHESHFKHHTPNPHSGAVGLIQFTPKTAKQLGTTTQQLAKMTATQQLDYVEKFYKSVGVKPGMDIGDLYMLTFIPTYAGVKNPNVVLGKKGGGILPGTDLSMNRIWTQNPVFSDGKSYFTIKDVKDRLEKFLA